MLLLYACERKENEKRRQGLFDRQNDRLKDGTAEREKEKARMRGGEGEQSYFVALAQLAAVNSYTIPRATPVSLLLAEFHSIRRHQSVLKSCWGGGGDGRGRVAREADTTTQKAFSEFSTSFLSISWAIGRKCLLPLSLPWKGNTARDVDDGGANTCLCGHLGIWPRIY